MSNDEKWLRLARKLWQKKKERSGVLYTQKDFLYQRGVAIEAYLLCPGTLHGRGVDASAGLDPRRHYAGIKLHRHNQALKTKINVSIWPQRGKVVYENKTDNKWLWGIDIVGASEFTFREENATIKLSPPCDDEVRLKLEMTYAIPELQEDMIIQITT